MLKTIEAVNSAVNNFIWGIPAMVCIIGVGLYLSFRTGFIQIRKFPYSIKNTLGRILINQKPRMDQSLRFRRYVPHLPEPLEREILPV